MALSIVKDPVYQQLNQVLRDLVRRERFVEGQQFLTEREVCDRFGVSRATANKALSSLVVEGILEFRKGVGTFLRAGVLDYDLGALVSFNDKAVAAGKTPTTRVIRFGIVKAAGIEPDVRKALALNDTDLAFALDRVRLADAVPVIYERRHIARAVCPDLSTGDVAGSLYAAWTQRHGLEIAGADQSIRAINVDANDATMLGVEPGSAGLLVTATGQVRDGRPLWHERTLYRSDMYEFHARLGGIRPAVSAVGQFQHPRRAPLG